MKNLHQRMLALTGAILFLSLSAKAQMSPVSWSFRADKLENGLYELVFTADVDDGWYIYSQHLDEGGPIPTTISFETADHFELVDQAEEAGDTRKEGMDELFGMNVIKYGKRAIFTQRIRVSNTSKPVKGSLEFMTCDDERCLPPKTIGFTIALEE